MISAAAFVLKAPEHRREILLEDGGSGGWFSSNDPAVGEPVPRFDHSRRAPLIVFACFADNAITHIADGRKGTSAGKGLVVLNMRSLEALARPIQLTELLKLAPSRVRTHLDRILTNGGKLPPKSLGAVIDIRTIFNPDDKGLFGGTCHSSCGDAWQAATEGPQKGRVLSYANVERKLTNTEFITLVANAWVGTTVPQSALLTRVIEEVIQSGKTVTLAVKSQPAQPAEDNLTTNLTA